MSIFSKALCNGSDLTSKENKNEFYIREILMDDLNEISFIHVQAWKEAYKNIFEDEYLQELDPQNKIASWKKTLENKENFSILALNSEGRIIGFASGGPDRGGTLKYGEIYAIYVLEKYQGLGIGYKLWKSLCSFLKECGYSHSKLWVLEKNKKAIDFYLRNHCYLTNNNKSIFLRNEKYVEISLEWKL